MLWLVAIVALGIAVAIPLMRSGPSGTARRLGKWLLVGVWASCVVALIGYVALSRTIGCWREDSVQGDERWTAAPFGQVCTYAPTEYRPADVTQPGWAPTAFFVITVVGAVGLIVGLSVNARRRTSGSVHSQTGGAGGADA